MSKPQLTAKDFETAATVIGCEVAAIKAVDSVESNGAGFQKDGKIIILFEPHIFWKELRRAGIKPELHQKHYPGLLSPTWNSALYKVGGSSWQKLAIAMSIHKEAALRACSWGRYQILGSNFAMVGFKSATALVEYLEKGEAEHLAIFIKYVKAAFLDDELRAKDWPGFARGYNGPAYVKNDYHGKLYRAYLKFKALAKGAAVVAMITGTKRKAA